MENIEISGRKLLELATTKGYDWPQEDRVNVLEALGDRMLNLGKTIKIEVKSLNIVYIVS